MSFVDDVVNTIGSALGGSAPKRRKYRYKVVSKGRIKSRHFTKKSALIAKKKHPYSSVLPINQKIARRKRRPVRRKRVVFRTRKRTRRRY